MQKPLASVFVPKMSKLVQGLISMLNSLYKLPFELSLVKLDLTF